MTHVSNRDRAKWAEAAILRFMNETGVEGDCEAVCDLIADLGHYCDRNQVDFLPLAERGICHWNVEQSKPDSIDELPDVSITIHQDLSPDAQQQVDVQAALTLSLPARWDEDKISAHIRTQLGVAFSDELPGEINGESPVNFTFQQEAEIYGNREPPRPHRKRSSATKRKSHRRSTRRPEVKS